MDGGRRMKAVHLVLALGVVCAAPAFGQTTAPVTGPSEVPPASYAGRDYVDSRGCAFARATVNGATRWMTRVDAAGQPVCGLTPSVAAPQVEVAGGAAPVATVVPAPVAASKVTRNRRAKTKTPPAIPDDRRVIAIGALHSSAAGCAGAPRMVPVVTLRNGARHAVCDDPGANPQARVLADGAGALGPALPSLAAPATMVHVGAYRIPANADAAADRLRSLGLPVARSTEAGLNLILTGPFGADEVRATLARLRADGFPDAYADVLPAAQPSQMP